MEYSEKKQEFEINIGGALYIIQIDWNSINEELLEYNDNNNLTTPYGEVLELLNSDLPQDLRNYCAFLEIGEKIGIKNRSITIKRIN